MPFDKYIPVENILENQNLTPAGKFLLILDQVPLCICGASCKTLRYLWDELGHIRRKEVSS